MFDQLNHILESISFLHLNILVLLGLALFGGTIPGNKLYKFDKDLNLIKEAEIKIDMQSMQKMMMQMMEKCPVSQQQGGMMGMQDSQAKLKCAEEWLKKAIELHELHMRDPKSTTDASQMELMEQIKKAYGCVTGEAVSSGSEIKQPEKQVETKTSPRDDEHHR